MNIDSILGKWEHMKKKKRRPKPEERACATASHAVIAANLRPSFRRLWVRMCSRIHAVSWAPSECCLIDWEGRRIGADAAPTQKIEVSPDSNRGCADPRFRSGGGRGRGPFQITRRGPRLLWHQISWSTGGGTCIVVLTMRKCTASGCDRKFRQCDELMIVPRTAVIKK
jgi:hypothetical protein